MQFFLPWVQICLGLKLMFHPFLSDGSDYWYRVHHFKKWKNQNKFNWGIVKCIQEQQSAVKEGVIDLYILP